MKQITKNTNMEMMEEELEKYNSERSITKSDIKKMMEEELANIKESPDRLIMQYQNAAKGAAMGLLTAGEDMAEAGSTDSASEYASYIIKQANVIVDAMVALEKYAQDPDAAKFRIPFDEGVSEARKRPLKRDRDAFDRNTQMVSDLQKTISSFLKETGAKLNQNHMNVIETMSTRLMHIANSPMIRLQEGDATSRMITKLEDIGSMIQEAVSYSQNPEAIERLERAEQLVTELFEDMHSLL